MRYRRWTRSTSSNLLGFWLLVLCADRCFGPREDAARQVRTFAETGLPQEGDRVCGAHATAAMRYDLPRTIQLVDSRGQIAQRDQMALQIADLVFVRLAHVQNENVVAP